MLATNQRVQVRSDHPIHPNRIGYFQFIASSQHDLVALTNMSLLTPDDMISEVFVVYQKDLVLISEK